MNYGVADSVIIAVAQGLLPDNSAIVIVKKAHGVLVITPDAYISDKVSREVVEALQYDGEIDTSSIQYLCFKCPDMVESWCAYVNSDYAVSLVTYSHSPLVKRRMAELAYQIRKILINTYDIDDLLKDLGNGL
nr:MAG TPA: hypothetical protein [Caudoviricetes sp.]